jgi:DNA-binding beta-propeller fold protein YncE
MKFALAAVLVAASLRPDTLLVLNKRDATLAFVDPAAMKVVAKIPTGEGPHEVAVSEDGKTAIVCNYGTGPNPGTTLMVVDVAARKELRRVTLPGLLRPHGIQAVGSRFYFTAEGSRAVARYDPAADRIDWIGGTGAEVTHMLVVVPGEKKIYTANIGGNSVSVLDLTNAPRQITLKQIAVAKGPEGIDLAPDGSAVWVAGRTPEGGITVIDPKTDAVVRTIATSTKFANRLKFTRDGKQVLISDPTNGDITILDTTSGEVVKKITTAAGPSGIQLTTDGKRLYVACAAAGKVQAYDTATWSVTGEVETGTEPDGMAYAAESTPAPATARPR